MSIVVLYCAFLVSVCLPLARVAGQEVTSQTPSSMGLGFGLVHPDNNIFTWLDYLGPNFVRAFFHPFVYSSEPEYNTQDWRQFVSNSWRNGEYGNQFGVSFAGEDVTNPDSFRNAVNDFRFRVQNGPVGMGIAEFLEKNHKEVNWNELLRRMTESADGITLMQQGIPEDYVKKLQDRDVGIMAVWDWDCTELEFLSTDPADPDYYRERFEDYRVMYIGGAWMAEHGITDIELYNEPDKDSCIDRTRWNSSYKIKSQALQDAFADYSIKSGVEIKPYIIAPATAASFPTNFAGDIIKDINMTFLADEPDENWRVLDAYSFHAYGSLPSGCTTISPTCSPSNGHKLRTKFDNARDNLDIRGYQDMDIHISEFNCYTFRTAEQLAGMHVMDEPSTSACVAAQIGSLYVRRKITKSISLHKIAQNRVTSVPSKVGKNGVLYGDTINPPFYASGSSKSAEVYRMILDRSLTGSGANKRGEKDVFKVYSRTHSFTSVNDIVLAWALKNDRSVSIFLVNQGWFNEEVEVDISQYGTMPNSMIVVSSVGNNEKMTSTLHGEVSGTIPVGTSSLITFNVPPNTVQEAQIPTVTSKVETIQAEAAVVLSPSSTATQGQGFRITSDNSDEPSVLVIKVDDYPQQSNVIYTILQLHVTKESTNTEPEIVTVFGYKNSDWNENELSWSNFGMLRTYTTPLNAAKDNVINWNDNNLVIVGHVTIPPSSFIKQEGTFVRVDITPFVQSGIRTFAMVRMVRYDQTGSGDSTLPQDKPQGIYYISSLKDSNESFRPLVIRSIEAKDAPSPPFDPIPPLESPNPPPPPPPPPPVCSYQGKYMIQALTCDRRYIAHSLSSSNRKVSLKSWRQAKNPRRTWKIKSETKQGDPTTLFASGRRTKYSYLAGTRIPSLQQKDELVRFYPVQSDDCSIVQLVSHNRAVKGRKAFLGTKSDCSGLRWSYSRVANGNKRYQFRLKPI
ncbi:hypothetical protein M9435_004842 [Picochlorum sp. BPE23]|nr:hypothetical protein M9435_004842 [Picochlorum sp. BPE23]